MQYLEHIKEVLMIPQTWLGIGVMIIFLTFIVKDFKKIKRKVFNAVIQADLLFDQGHGEEKLKFVIDSTYDFLPVMIRKFMSKPMYSKLVARTVDEILDYLSDRIVEDMSTTEMLTKVKV